METLRLKKIMVSVKSLWGLLAAAGLLAGLNMSGAGIPAGAPDMTSVSEEEAAPAVRVVITKEDSLRAADLVSRMTLEEKISYIAGEKSFHLRAVDRLGIPAIKIADGPVGIRNNTKSTLYPCGTLTASAWNRELASRLGHGLGQDAKARGVSILLGPGVNIYRAPMLGRNYEYFGEDPYLTSETAKQYILGVQDEGVMAVVKHFAANNQLEPNRHSVSSDVDERTLHEIYFPAFRKAVQEAGVGSVMDSYNLVWGLHSTENPWLNIRILRDLWGFDGIVMSDWTSVYSTSGAVNGGLDLECPKAVYFTLEKILPLMETGVIDEAAIDEKVQHILQTFSAFGFLDAPAGDPSIPEDNPASRQTALDIARQGIVLLKNEAVGKKKNALPLGKGHILVLGPNADVIPTGGGSGFVTPISTVSVYQGLKNACGEKNVELLSDAELYKDIIPEIRTSAQDGQQGFNVRYYNNVRPEGEIFFSGTEQSVDHAWGYGSPMEGLPDDKFAAAWSGFYTAVSDGVVRFEMAGDDGYRITVDGKVLGGDWGNHSYSTRTAFLDVKAGQTYDILFEFFDNAGEAKVSLKAGLMDESLLEKSIDRADAVVFCAGFNSNTEGEGWDRPFAMQKSQTDLISRITSMHDNVAVVINAGGGVDFRGWSDGVEAILMAWYPGQEGGTAVAEILTGKISPSGKLPITIERSWEDNPVHDSYYDEKKRVTYTEGVFVGYRGYDRKADADEVWATGKCWPEGVCWPFGYGLSYTSFEYSGLNLERISDTEVRVDFNVTNTGRMDAWETAQIYVGDVECSVPRPLKELKGYEKVFLKKGETKHVSVTLDAGAFSFFDIRQDRFVVEPGTFRIYVGPSSAELPLRQEITL